MTDSLQPVRVWDLPTRLFHWALAACVVGSVVSAKIGGNAMVWHFRLGYAVLTLLAFRLLWGLIGGHWSRFTRFIYSPREVLRYVRGRSLPDDFHDVGHSPVGAMSVFGLLGILALQVGTGLFADDEIASTGPLIRYVSSDTSLALTAWHKGWGEWLVIGLVALHLFAVAFYFWGRRRNLVRPMLLGDKHLPAGVPESADHWQARGLALLVVTLCGIGVAWLASLGG